MTHIEYEWVENISTFYQNKKCTLATHFPTVYASTLYIYEYDIYKRVNFSTPVLYIINPLCGMRNMFNDNKCSPVFLCHNMAS